MPELSDAIIELLTRYYQNRANHKEKPWNKTADLDAIFVTANVAGWSTETCAGTFWFSKPSPLGKVVVRVNEENHRAGGTCNVAQGNAYGCFSEIAAALKKAGKPEPLFINANTGEVSVYEE